MSADSASDVLPRLSGHTSIYRLIVATSIGNALEFYDLVVYGYFASTLSKCRFGFATPRQNKKQDRLSYGVSGSLKTKGKASFPSLAKACARGLPSLNENYASRSAAAPW